MLLNVCTIRVILKYVILGKLESHMLETETVSTSTSDLLSKIIVSEPKRNRSLVLSALEKLVGHALMNVFRQHIVPADLLEDGTMVRCLSMREARNTFSAKKIKAGVRVFAPSKGDNAEEPMVVMSLTELVDMLVNMQANSSVVNALAVSDDLPIASPLKVRVGRHGRGPRLTGGAIS